MAISFSCSKQNESDGRDNENNKSKTGIIKETNAESNAPEDTVPHEKIVVTDFFATWCPPCRELTPYFEKWANTYKSDVEFRKVDVDQDQMEADENDIEALPTVVIYSPDGTEITRVVGFDPEAIEMHIKQAIEDNRK